LDLAAVFTVNSLIQSTLAQDGTELLSVYSQMDTMATKWICGE